MDTIKTLLNLCPVPMVIISEDDKALFVNESFTRLLGFDIDDIPDVNHWFALAYPNDEAYRKDRERSWREASSQFQKEIDFTAGGRQANVTCKDGCVRIVEIFGANMGGKNNLIVLVDITEKEKHRQEKERLIHGLNKALLEVDTLRGILPICSFCKKVRDDKGYWEQVDVYISKHSQADISHSVCPECLEKQYPKMYKKIEKDENAE
jgi:PAS domain S-box-containing protein